MRPQCSFALALLLGSLGFAEPRASDQFPLAPALPSLSLRNPLREPTTPSATSNLPQASPLVAPEREEVVPQIAHVSEVWHIAVAPGGAYVVTTGRDGLVKQWTPDGRLLRTFPGPDLVNHIAFSPDGRVMAVSGWYERVIHLRESTGKLIRWFTVDVNGVHGWPYLAFGPDGNWFVACSNFGTAECRVLDLTGNVVRALPVPGDAGQAVGIAVAPDGSAIYAALAHGIIAWSPDGTVRWRANVGTAWAQDLALSPDGTCLAVVAGERPFWPKLQREPRVPNVLWLWDLNGKQQAELPWHESQSLAFTPDGAHLVSGGTHDGHVLILDRASRSVSHLKLGGPGRLSPSRVAPAPDGRSLLVAAEADRPGAPRIFDLEGRRLGRFAGTGAGVTAVALDPTGKVVVTTASDGKVRFLSLDGRLLRRFASGEEYPTHVAVDPKGRFVVTGSETIVAWDGQGKPVARARVGKGQMTSTAFSADGRTLLAGTSSGEILFVPVAPGGRSARVRAWGHGGVRGVAIDPAGALIAAGGGGNEAVLVGTDGKVRAKLAPPGPFRPGFASGLAFLSGGKEVLVASGALGRQLAVYDLEGNLLRSVDTGNRFLSGGMALSPSGNLVAVTVNYDVGLYDPSTLLPKGRLLRGHRDNVTSLAFTADERHLVTGSSDGTVRIWNVASGESAAIFSSGDEWVIFTDDGYFDGSRRASDLLALVVGTDGFGIDQVALARNRPDLIYKRLGLLDEAQLEHLAAHHAARLREAGLEERAAPPALAAPRVRITAAERDGKEVVLDLEVIAAEQDLRSLQIWSNGVPLLGGEGRDLAGRASRLKERVELAQGKNRIEVGARDVAGVESRRATVLLERKVESHGALWFVGLGVSRYRDRRLDLRVAHRDPELFAAALRKGATRYTSFRSLVLTDADVTRAALARIREFLASAAVDDTVILLASGHGARDPSTQATFQFVSHEADVADLRGTTIALDELEGLLSGTKARGRLLLLDACQSGDIDPETLEAIRTRASASGLTVRWSPGREEVNTVPRTYLANRDRYVYVHLRRETGVVRFTSSLGTEVSVESEKLGSGLFTAALLRALGSRELDRKGDGWISIGDLESAVKLIVTRASNGIQHPTIDRENPLQELRLPVLH